MSKFEREIIKEFLEAIIPDKTNRLFIRTKTCPLGIWITGKQIKAKLKDSLEKALHSQNQELLEKIEDRIRTEEDTSWGDVRRNLLDYLEQLSKDI